MRPLVNITNQGDDVCGSSIKTTADRNELRTWFLDALLNKYISTSASFNPLSTSVSLPLIVTCYLFDCIITLYMYNHIRFFILNFENNTSDHDNMRESFFLFLAFLFFFVVQ